MTKEQQTEYVKDISDFIIDEIIEVIDKGAIPERWSAMELRQYMADSFRRKSPLDEHKKSSQLRKEYENDVLVNNL